MVMEGSKVVRATGDRIVGVIEGVAEVASGVGTGGVVSAGSLPCSSYGGTGGDTMGGEELLEVQNIPPTDSIC